MQGPRTRDAAVPAEVEAGELAQRAQREGARVADARVLQAALQRGAGQAQRARLGRRKQALCTKAPSLTKGQGMQGSCSSSQWLCTSQPEHADALLAWIAATLALSPSQTSPCVQLPT